MYANQGHAIRGRLSLTPVIGRVTAHERILVQASYVCAEIEAFKVAEWVGVSSWTLVGVVEAESRAAGLQLSVGALRRVARHVTFLEHAGWSGACKRRRCQERDSNESLWKTVSVELKRSSLSCGVHTLLNIVGRCWEVVSSAESFWKLRKNGDDSERQIMSDS